MATRAGAPSESQFRFTIRIPGVLLAILLAGLGGWFAVTHLHGSTTSYSPLARADVFRQQVDGNVWSGDVLVESHDTISRPIEGWTLVLDDRQRVPAAVSSDTPPSPYMRRLVLHLFARIPPGRMPLTIAHDNYITPGGLGESGAIPVTRQ